MQLWPLSYKCEEVQSRPSGLVPQSHFWRWADATSSITHGRVPKQWPKLLMMLHTGYRINQSPQESYAMLISWSCTKEKNNQCGSDKWHVNNWWLWDVDLTCMHIEWKGQYQGVQCQSFVLLYVTQPRLNRYKGIELLTAWCSCVAWAETGTWLCRKFEESHAVEEQRIVKVIPQRKPKPEENQDNGKPGLVKVISQGIPRKKGAAGIPFIQVPVWSLMDLNPLPVVSGHWTIADRSTDLE